MGDFTKGLRSFMAVWGKQDIIKRSIIIWPRNTTPECIPKRNENVCPYRNMYMNVHGSIIYNSHKIERI